jgi:hypothetical protein
VAETRVVVIELQPNEREEIVDGVRVSRGRTLASLTRELGGHEGEVRRPSNGEMFHVSLEAWQGRDPHSTWLDIMFETDI